MADFRQKPTAPCQKHMTLPGNAKPHAREGPNLQLDQSEERTNNVLANKNNDNNNINNDDNNNSDNNLHTKFVYF